MPRLSPDRSASLLKMHGWFAVWLGLLLYVLVVTGMVSVFAREISNWSSPLRSSARMELPAELDRALRNLATSVEPQYLEDVSVYTSAGGRIRAFFHTYEVHPVSGEAEEIGVDFDLDPRTLEVIARRDGWEEESDARNTSGALAVFLVTLHMQLHVPGALGLMITGCLGLALLVLAVTGLFTQPNFLRDLFTRRGQGATALAARDAHSRAGSWVLPFAIVLAFTGTYFSFVDSFGFPAMAQASFDGDEDRLAAALDGLPAMKEDARPAPLGNLDAMIADIRARSGALPTYLEISRWGRADSQVLLYSAPAGGKLIGPSYLYGAVDGELRYVKPTLGLVPSVGGVIAELATPLHFGNFAGVASKLVWLALGFGTAYVALTGMLLWCRRRNQVRGWRRYARVVHWAGFGLPLALATTPYGYFLARAAGHVETEGAMGMTFIAAALVAGGLALALRDLGSIKRSLLGLTGLALTGLPLVRWLADGPGWRAALGFDLHAVLALDIAFVLAGALFLRFASRRDVMPPAQPAA